MGISKGEQIKLDSKDKKIIEQLQLGQKPSSSNFFIIKIFK